MKNEVLVVCVVLLGSYCLLSLPVFGEGAGTTHDSSGGVVGSTHSESLVSPLSPETELHLGKLIEELKNPNARIAKKKIRMIGNDAVPSLIQALDEKETIQSQQIVELLGNFRDPRTLPKMVELMQNENPWLRCAAVYAVGKIGGDEAVPYLLECLRDKNCQVCEISVDTLVAMDEMRAVPVLIELIRDSDNPMIAKKSAEGLSSLTRGIPDYGTDWASWQMWYESDPRFQDQENKLSLK